MMATYQKKFIKDLKRLERRGKSLSKLKVVTRRLIENKPLAKSLKDHALKGEYADCRECHIEPDWLLIYIIDGNNITFVRTGTHSDLFK